MILLCKGGDDCDGICDVITLSSASSFVVQQSNCKLLPLFDLDVCCTLETISETGSRKVQQHTMCTIYSRGIINIQIIITYKITKTRFT